MVIDNQACEAVPGRGHIELKTRVGQALVERKSRLRGLEMPRNKNNSIRDHEYALLSLAYRKPPGEMDSTAPG